MTLKAMLAAGCGLLAGLSVDSAAADVLLVGNRSGHTLYALDLAGGERRAAFDTAIGPHEVEVSPRGRLAVTTDGSDHVVVIERGEVLRRIPVGEGVAHMVAVSQDLNPTG